MIIYKNSYYLTMVNIVFICLFVVKSVIVFNFMVFFCLNLSLIAMIRGGRVSGQTRTCPIRVWIDIFDHET